LLYVVGEDPSVISKDVAAFTPAVVEVPFTILAVADV
jgi:hypothetical protein